MCRLGDPLNHQGKRILLVEDRLLVADELVRRGKPFDALMVVGQVAELLRSTPAR